MATHIKDIINGFLESKKEQLSIAYKVDEILKKNLSKEVSGNIRFAGVEEGHFLFSCESSVFTYEFTLNREKLLKEIQQNFPQAKEIKIKIK